MYREYIAHELKGKDLARISCIYMRALADHCLDVELWREYLKYLVRVGCEGVRMRVVGVEGSEGAMGFGWAWGAKLCGVVWCDVIVWVCASPYLGAVVVQDSSLKVRDTVLQAHRQAIRNCPWSVEVWVTYVRAMERLQCSHEEVVGEEGD